MTHQKPNLLKSFLPFLPAVGLLVSFVCGYSILNYRVAQAEDNLKDQKLWIIKQSQDANELKVVQAETKAKVDLIYEAIKDVRRNQP